MPQRSGISLRNGLRRVAGGPARADGPAGEVCDAYVAAMQRGE